MPKSKLLRGILNTKPLFKEGQVITFKGDQTGKELHFEVRKVLSRGRLMLKELKDA